MSSEVPCLRSIVGDDALLGEGNLSLLEQVTDGMRRGVREMLRRLAKIIQVAGLAEPAQEGAGALELAGQDAVVVAVGDRV